MTTRKKTTRSDVLLDLPYHVQDVGRLQVAHVEATRKERLMAKYRCFCGRSFKAWISAHKHFLKPPKDGKAHGLSGG
jgi:hypothetical protein